MQDNSVIAQSNYFNIYWIIYAFFFGPFQQEAAKGCLDVVPERGIVGISIDLPKYLPIKTK